MYNTYSKEYVLKKIRQIHYMARFSRVALNYSSNPYEQIKAGSFEDFLNFYDKNWLDEQFSVWEIFNGLNPSKHINKAMEDILDIDPLFSLETKKPYYPYTDEERQKFEYSQEISDSSDIFSSKNSVFGEAQIILEAKKTADYFLFNNYVEMHYKFTQNFGRYDAIALITKMSKYENEEFALNKYFELRESYKEHLKAFAIFVANHYKIVIPKETDITAEYLYDAILEHTDDIKESVFGFVRLYEAFIKNEQIQTYW